MENPGKNGICANENEDEELIAEEDIVQVVDLEPNSSHGMIHRND